MPQGGGTLLQIGLKICLRLRLDAFLAPVWLDQLTDRVTQTPTASRSPIWPLCGAFYVVKCVSQFGHTPYDHYASRGGALLQIGLKICLRLRLDAF